ncbi:Polysaccharide biosynthesis protein [Gallibacterium anatis]|uniref:Polysaccharide biosynthesis protein n=1 Tax=Gallibacterium anatis TaxID=750 RepID=A0A377H657_9PAST|nr:polysaccharide biosynthesis C-terminal domain-containing protein [Gallibacterium anatis]STO38096.1 Polysaccharide biosynthesis protein [Gallibacterium anatis]
MSYNYKYVSLISNIAIFMFGSFLSKLLAFLLIPLYTSVLTAEQYGIAELYNSILEIVFPFTTLCIIEALYRFSIDEHNLNILFSNSIAVIFIGSIVFITISLVIYYFIYPYKYVKEFILLYLSMSFYMLATQFSRGLGHSKRYAIYGILNTLILVLSSYYFLKILNLGISGYLLSFSLGYAITAIIAFFLSQEYKYLFPVKFNMFLMIKMFKYSVPNIPNMVSWWVNNILDRYIILFFLGIESTGLYIAASKLPSIINLLSSVFQKAWQYSTAKESKEIDSKDNVLFFSNVFNVYQFICFLLSFFIISIIEPISYFILNEKFFAAWKFVPILLIAATFGCLSTYFGVFYNAIKDNKNLMISTIYGAFVNFLLNIVLIPILGIFGAVISTATSYGIIAYLRYRDLNNRIGLILNKKVIFSETVLLIIYSIYIIFSSECRLYLIDLFFLTFIVLLNKDTSVLIYSELKSRTRIKIFKVRNTK